MTRRRLLKVIVEPVFVDDDGDTLVEVVAPRTTVPAHKIDDFPLELWEQLDEYNRTVAGPAAEVG